jgi:hypothetical protein
MAQSEQFLCGPLALSLNAPRGALLDKFVETLGLYDVVWEPPHPAVKIDVVRTGAPAPMAAEGKVVVGLPPGLGARARDLQFSTHWRGE